MKNIIIIPKLKPFKIATFISSLYQNSCPVLDAEEVKKQEQKEAIKRLNL